MSVNKRESTIIIINSTAYYLLSYLLVYLVFQFFTLLASQIFSIPNTLYYNRIAYNVKPEAWTFDSVQVIYSSGCVGLFLLSIFFLVFVIRTIEFDGLLRTLFFWGFTHSISMLIGSFIIGAFNFEGIGIVMSYLYLTDTTKMVILFSGLIVLFAVGMAMVKPMLFLANSYYNFLTPEMRPFFRKNHFLIPFWISTLLLLVIKYPLSLYEALLLITPLFILLPLSWGTNSLPSFYFEQTEKSINPNFRIIVMTALLYLIYRIALGFGINIG